MDNQPSLTIIMPIYNAEKYLTNSIESILQQSYSSFELICVINGSKDNSKEICEKYQKSDNRITIINQDNFGVAYARQTGLSVAKGEFIIFIDADDCILNRDAFQELLNLVSTTKADLIYSDYYQEDYKGKIKLIKEPGLSNPSSMIHDVLQRKCHGALWNKLYKNSIIKHFNLCFIENINYGEDLLFNVRYLQHSNMIYHNHNPYYKYYIRAGSLMNSINNKTLFLEQMRYLKELEELLNSSLYFKSLEILKLNFKSSMITSNFFTSQECNDFYDITYKNLIRNKINIKIKLHLLLAKLGFFKLSQILGKFYNYAKKSINR